MPNWCEGNLRVRGSWMDICSFFKENIVALKHSKDPRLAFEEVKPEVDITDWHIVIKKPDKDCEKEFYITDTNRQFILKDEIRLENLWIDEKAPDIVVVADHYRGAWNIDGEAYVEKAKKYNVDIKIIGYDCGMQFEEIVEVHKDGTILDRCKRYNDWCWECPEPYLGG